MLEDFKAKIDNPRPVYDMYGNGIGHCPWYGVSQFEMFYCFFDCI